MSESNEVRTSNQWQGSRRLRSLTLDESKWLAKQLEELKMPFDLIELVEYKATLKSRREETNNQLEG